MAATLTAVIIVCTSTIFGQNLGGYAQCQYDSGNPDVVAAYAMPSVIPGVCGVAPAPPCVVPAVNTVHISGMDNKTKQRVEYDAEVTNADACHRFATKYEDRLRAGLVKKGEIITHQCLITDTINNSLLTKP